MAATRVPRAIIASFLESDTPVAVTRHGETLAFTFLPGESARKQPTVSPQRSPTSKNCVVAGRRLPGIQNDLESP